MNIQRGDISASPQPESKFWLRLQLIRESELRQAEKHLLYVLFFYAGDDGDCWPAVATLARDISATPRQVRRTMRGLEKAQLIEITHHAGRSNSVRINWQGLTKKAGVTEAPGVTESTGEGGQNRQGTPGANVRGPLAHLSPKHKRNTQGTLNGTPKGGRARFVPPTLGEVQAYCRERGKGVDPERFINHYTANGWMRGKTPIKDWRAAVRTWETNGYDRHERNGKPGSGSPATRVHTEEGRSEFARICDS